MSLGQDYQSGILWTGEAAAAIERSATDERTFAELDPSELQSLMRLQESQNSLLAYAHLAIELGLEPSSPAADVGAALHRLDLTLDEVTDWLVGCNYDLDCFRQTMFVELRAARRRLYDRRAKTVTLVATVLVAGTFAWKRWRRR